MHINELQIIKEHKKQKWCEIVRKHGGRRGRGRKVIKKGWELDRAGVVGIKKLDA